MAVDLTDLVPDLQAEISPPGSNFFPAATDDNFVAYLRNAFWDAKLDGFLAAWTEADGLVKPVDTVNGTDITRDFLQLVIFYAGFSILRAAFRNQATTTRSVAGPVSFEQQNSSVVLRELIKEMQTRRDILLRRLSDLGTIPTAYVDAVIARTDSIQQGDVWYTAGRMWTYTPYSGH